MNTEESTVEIIDTNQRAKLMDEIITVLRNGELMLLKASAKIEGMDDDFMDEVEETLVAQSMVDGEMAHSIDLRETYDKMNLLRRAIEELRSEQEVS